MQGKGERWQHPDFSMQGHITTIPPHDTPLNPNSNTSSLQIPIQNLHSFRILKSGWEFHCQMSLGQGHSTMIPVQEIRERKGISSLLAKVKGHIATISHLCPQYTIPSNTNPKSVFVQEIHSRREFQGQRSMVKGHIATLQPCITPLSHNTSSLQIPTADGGHGSKNMDGGHGLEKN
jgi:hypothetical protein